MSNQVILAFGHEEYNSVINPKIDYIAILSDFVIVTAMKVNRGVPLGDEFYWALTHLCCQEILDKYICLNGILN